MFLGDGRAPYTLAWGNHESTGSANTLSPLLENGIADAQRRSAQVTMATIEDAGGEQRLAPAAG